MLHCIMYMLYVLVNNDRGVYSQEFVANGVEKSWSQSYKIIFNYRLLIMLK